jgi:cholesterol oxidase
VTGRYDVVVVGSGFGGSISALRLAQHGRSVLVLERGRRWGPDEFPRDIRRTDEVFWRRSPRSSSGGLYDVRFLSGLGVVVASGVGGGSLVYANIHIRPDEVVFDDPRWPESINRRTLKPYYDKVAAEIGLAPLPEAVALPKRDAFRRAGATLQREVFDPDEAVTWPGAGGPGHAGECQLVAECEFGCPHGAKHSMDRTYLADAERLGVEVRTSCQAYGVRPEGDGYAVGYRDLATGELSTVAGRRVVLAAGTLGTNELLLRSRHQLGVLPALSARLGEGFSANGDFLATVQGAATDLDPSRGPDVTSVMRFFDETPGFTMAAPTFNAPVMAVLASLGQPSGRWLRPFGDLLWRALPWLVPFACAHGALSRPSRLPAPHRGDPRRMTNLFCIGRDNANGRVTLDRRGLDVVWDYLGENRALVARMEEAMARVADAYGGTYAPIVTWEACRRIFSVHPLGGCHLSDSPATGVVSPHGEVHGYPGLFVADGSVIPTSIGFHPVMTISAVAEHTAEAVVASFPG